MNPITAQFMLTCIIITVCAVALLSALAIAVLTWIGRGEPDVNGDPERDAFGEVQSSKFKVQSPPAQCAECGDEFYPGQRRYCRYQSTRMLCALCFLNGPTKSPVGGNKQSGVNLSAYQVEAPPPIAAPGENFNHQDTKTPRKAQ